MLDVHKRVLEQIRGATRSHPLYASGGFVPGFGRLRPYTQDKPAMLYDKPNGGHRILPSVYGRLLQLGREPMWLRGNGEYQHVATMNPGHLRNTLNLLKESNGNAVAKATSLLGKMALHFQNQPAIVRKLEELCVEMQRVDVDEMYPIYTVLAEHLAHSASFYERPDVDEELSWD